MGEVENRNIFLRRQFVTILFPLFAITVAENGFGLWMGRKQPKGKDLLLIDVSNWSKLTSWQYVFPLVRTRDGTRHKRTRCACHGREKAIRTDGLSLPEGQATKDAGQAGSEYLGI